MSHQNGYPMLVANMLMDLVARYIILNFIEGHFSCKQNLQYRGWCEEDPIWVFRVY